MTHVFLPDKIGASKVPTAISGSKYGESVLRGNFLKIKTLPANMGDRDAKYRNVQSVLTDSDIHRRLMNQQCLVMRKYSRRDGFYFLQLFYIQRGIKAA